MPSPFLSSTRTSLTHHLSHIPIPVIPIVSSLPHSAKLYTAMASTADKRPTTPPATSQQQQGGGSAWFPLSASAAFSQWWAALAPAHTEHQVLSFIPYVKAPILDEPAVKCKSKSHPTNESSSSVVSEEPQPDPYGSRKWLSNMINLSGKNRALNEFSIEREGEEVENNMVMLHGYGAGLGFFYQNFESMSRLPGWRLYALDLLGMGRSSRPPFKIHAKERDGKIQEAENFFIDALEEWRIQKKIDKMTLLGHSMGGYMATCYALKYPGRVKKLILVSPVGFPEDPYAVNEALPEPDVSTMQNEFTQSQQDLTSPQKDKAPRRVIPWWVTTLWDANVSPFSIVRWAGPLGPRLASGWTTRRFDHLPAEQKAALHDYSYSIFRQRGSGEYALAYILAPGAHARSPLIRRIQGVGRQILETHDAPTVDSQTSPAPSGVKRENGVPIVFMYGSKDWMDINGGLESAKKILNATEEALKTQSPKERKRDQGSVKVLEVSKAGHHLYLDK
jgi:cardiolipin-specific phospholipase